MQVEVIRTYTAKQPDELSLQVADVVLVSQTVEDGTSIPLVFLNLHLLPSNMLSIDLPLFISPLTSDLNTTLLFGDLKSEGAKVFPLSRNAQWLTSLLTPCPRLVRGRAAAGRREGLVPRRVRRAHHMPCHDRAQRAADGPPEGAGDQRVTGSRPRCGNL